MATPIMQREEWVRETQMFQRIAGNPETPAEELAAEWDSMRLRQRRANSDSLRASRGIQQAAQRGAPVPPKPVPQHYTRRYSTTGSTAPGAVLPGLAAVAEAAEQLAALARQLQDGGQPDQKRRLEERVALMRGALNYVVPANRLDTDRMKYISKQHSSDIQNREVRSAPARNELGELW